MPVKNRASRVGGPLGFLFPKRLGPEWGIGSQGQSPWWPLYDADAMH